MTGREAFRIIYKCRPLFIPVALTGRIWITYLKPVFMKAAIIWRYFLYMKCFNRVGNNVSIHRNVTIRYPERITLGDNVSIHTLCYLDGEGGLDIGNDVSIAHNTSIMTSNHSWEDRSIPIKYNPTVPAKVSIGNDVWIGAGVRILAGVSIGNRCVIAAGAVVNKSCEPDSIYAGIPARKVKVI